MSWTKQEEFSSLVSLIPENNNTQYSYDKKLCQPIFQQIIKFVVKNVLSAS